MPVFTGTLWDAGLGHLAGKAPQLIFTLNAPNAIGSAFYVTEPVVANVASDGTFTVTLAATVEMQFAAYYSVSVRWLDSANNFVRVDYPEWQIFTPSTGGDFGSIIGAPPTNQRFLYVSLVPPSNPVPFMVWRHVDPTNQDSSQSTGNDYEWRNV